MAALTWPRLSTSQYPENQVDPGNDPTGEDSDEKVRSIASTSQRDLLAVAG